MNLPNKLTVLRIALIPVFMAVLYWGFPGANYAALVIFILASLTDLLDGKIARARNLVTDFGKFADPLADKMLVTAAMLWFVFRRTPYFSAFQAVEKNGISHRSGPAGPVSPMRSGTRSPPGRSAGRCRPAPSGTRRRRGRCKRPTAPRSAHSAGTTRGGGA